MTAAEAGDEVRVPHDLRPGQMSIPVLGRVIIGDIAVTLVDLARRGLVTVTEIPDSETTSAGWALAVPAAPASSPRQNRVVAYETVLLDGLSGYGQPVQLQVLAAEFAPLLGKARAELVREAVRRGWVRRWHHGQRTPKGEEAARQLRAFRGTLRRLRGAEGEDALAADWLPYALHFGLVPCDRIPLARFARSWVDAFSGLDGWSHATPRPRGPGDEVPLSKDEWRGMSLGLAAGWETPL